MTSIVAKSVPVPEIPWGPQRRLPHGINYLHGAVHFAAGILIFNDFKDAIFHFTDPAFRREVRLFAREERREILLIFRNREYDTAEFAFLVSFLRLTLPWFANSNGPRRHVLWGNPAPYPVVNIITGDWKTDTYRLKRMPNSLDLVRPPVPAGRYFQGVYRGTRDRLEGRTLLRRPAPARKNGRARSRQRDPDCLCLSARRRYSRRRPVIRQP